MKKILLNAWFVRLTIVLCLVLPVSCEEYCDDHFPVGFDFSGIEIIHPSKQIYEGNVPAEGLSFVLSAKTGKAGSSWIYAVSDSVGENVSDLQLFEPDNEFNAQFNWGTITAQIKDRVNHYNINIEPNNNATQRIITLRCKSLSEDMQLILKQPALK